MADDPYTVLGLAREATADDIRRAFREGAKKNHPDLNPGNPGAEERFKAMSAAHELLSDPEARGRFDRGEIDASGQPAAAERPRWRDYAHGEQGNRYGSRRRPEGGFGPNDPDGMGDIFSDLFGAGGRRAGPQRGRDERYGLAVGFLDAIRGATRRLTLPDARTLDVSVPAGIETGQTLRLRGRGGSGQEGGPDGDALIEIEVLAHPLFTRDGDDVRIEVPVGLREAVLGGRITVPTPAGPVAMTVPERSDGGRTLRLRGRGVAARAGRKAGDLYVVLRITLAEADDRLAAFLRDWTPEHPDDPRRAMDMEMEEDRP